MDLHLVPNDPEKTVLVSTNGVAHYKVTTSKARTFGRPATTLIQRPADCEEDSIVAEIEWRRWSHPVVRSCIFDGVAQELEVREFLYKLGRKFSTTRYFLGNDNEEYRWKTISGVGLLLTNRRTKEEVARFRQDIVEEGLFAGERKWTLSIDPSSVDIDMIVLSFIITEKRRRDREEEREEVYRDADVCEGGCEVGC